VRINIGNSIFKRYGFALRNGCSRFVHLGLGPRKIIVADPHEVGDGDGNSIVDRAELAGRDLLLEPFLLFPGQLDIHGANIAYRLTPRYQVGFAGTPLSIWS
jgi:hypothetical protein